MRVTSFAALVLLAFATPVTAHKVETAFSDLGLEPEDPIGATKKLMLDELRDPDSAQYRFIGIHPAHCKAGWAKGNNGWTGYAATVEINAKNAMGGYVGFASYTVLFINGYAWKSIEGTEFGAYGPSKGMLGLGGGAGVCRWLDH
jgi:hypothetical protein